MLSLRLRWVLLIFLAVSVFAFGQNVHAAKGSSGDKSKQAVTVDVGTLQEKDVDPFLASLTDAQARAVLQKTLKEQAGLREDTAVPPQESYLMRAFAAFESKVRGFTTEFGALSDAAQAEIANPQPIIDKLAAAYKFALNDSKFTAYAKNNGLDVIGLSGKPAKDFMNTWRSQMSWLIYDAGAGKTSPEKFGIPKPTGM